MYFAFLLTIAAGAAYFLFAVRRFDFLSVFFFAGVLYSSPAIVGRIALNRYNSMFMYTTEAYVIIVSFFIVLLVGTIAHDVIFRRARPPRGVDDSGDRDYFALMAGAGVVLGAGCLAVVILQDSQLMLAEPGKVIMLEGMDSRFYSYYTIFTLHAILAAYRSRRPVIFAAATALGLCDVWIGFRFLAVMSVIGILVAASQQVLKPLYRRWIFCTVGAATTLSLVLARRLYGVIKYQEWTRIDDEINDYFMEIVMHGFPIGEVIGPSLLFLGSISAGVDLGYQHVVSALPALVPLMERIGGGGKILTYNDYVQEPVLGVPGTAIGYGESNFGSWYAVGGIFGVIFFSCCYTGLIIVMMSLMRRARLTCTLYLTWLPILTFYNFRSDFYNMAAYSKLVVMIWIVLAVFAAVVTVCRTPASPRAAPPPTCPLPSPG